MRIGIRIPSKSKIEKSEPKEKSNSLLRDKVEALPDKEYDEFFNSLGQSGKQLWLYVLNGLYTDDMSGKYPIHCREKVFAFVDKLVGDVNEKDE